MIKNDLVAAAVLSGNRNFEARVHQSIKANFLMSPPLVVAFALAGRIDIDMTTEPLGKGTGDQDVYLKDIWPTLDEIHQQMKTAIEPEMFRNFIATSLNESEVDDILRALAYLWWDPKRT